MPLFKGTKRDRIERQLDTDMKGEAMDTLIAGQRVRLVKPVDNTPDAYVGDGATGIITRIESECIWVQLDEFIHGLAEWDNQLQIYDWPDYPARETLEVIP